MRFGEIARSEALGSLVCGSFPGGVKRRERWDVVGEGGDGTGNSGGL